MIEEFKSLSKVQVTPREQKYNVRRYNEKKSRWHRKAG